MIKFLKNNWFRIIIALLLVFLVRPVINYIDTETRYTIQKHNFSIFKWVIDKGTTKSFEGIQKRFGL